LGLLHLRHDQHKSPAAAKRDDEKPNGEPNGDLAVSSETVPAGSSLLDDSPTQHAEAVSAGRTVVSSQMRGKTRRKAPAVSQHTFYLQNSQRRLKLVAKNEVRILSCLMIRILLCFTE
jgi:hypothetical protein